MFYAPFNLALRYFMAKHLPVLLREVLDLLAPRAGQLFLDCTFGGGGHSGALLDAAPDIRVVALDCDPEAVTRAEAFKSRYGERFKFYDENFTQLDMVSENGFDGAIFDLGLSTFQLEKPERGFSFQRSGPADMRMDTRTGISAAEFLESASREKLITAIRIFGEEPRWRRVIDAIISARGTSALQDTILLAELLSKAVGGKRMGRRTRIHPATRTFQGIRIMINQELKNLEEALPKAFEKLAPAGALATISFHSHEDRIVKRYFRRMAGESEHAGDSTPKQFRVRRAMVLTRKPIIPTPEEISRNPRSRSAKLRVLKKEVTL